MQLQLLHRRLSKGLHVGAIIALIISSLGITALPAAAASAQVIFEDNFNSGNLASWTSAGAKWSVSSSRAVANGNIDGTTTEGYLVKSISTAGYTNIVLSYRYVSQNFGSGDSVNVDYSTNGGTSWATSTTITASATATSTLNLSSSTTAVENNSSFAIRFRVKGTPPSSNNFSLDNVSLTGVAIPATGSITGTIYGDADGDATKDGSEAGLAGWTVSLTGPATASTTTDIDGNYAFSALADGTYSVCLTTPDASWSQTAPAGCHSAVVTSGGATTGKDFGVIQYGSVTIVADATPATTTAVFSAALDGLATTSFSATYTFNNVIPGTHRLDQVLPADWINQGASCNNESATSSVIVSAAEEVTCTFDNLQLATLILQKEVLPSSDDTKFTFTGDFSTATSDPEDTEGLGDGDSMMIYAMPGEVYTATEEAVAGWDVNEISCEDPTDDSNGSLASSTAYFVPEAGEQITCTFTNEKRGSLTVTKIADPDEGWFTFMLTLIGGEYEEQTVEGSGTIEFENLPVASYQLTETVPEGWDGEQTAECNLNGGDYSDYEFGDEIEIGPGDAVNCIVNNSEYGVITGSVFHDQNISASYDEGDDLLAGWTVNLYQRLVEEGPFSIIDSTVSTLAGYTFGDLRDGEYAVCREVPTGETWFQTYPASGTACENGSTGHIIQLLAGELSADWDFGAYQTGSIAGEVWHDDNTNGLHDEGEVVLAGRTVTLYYSDGTTPVSQEGLTNPATTNGSGIYRFDDLMPGDYVVGATAPTNWLAVSPSTGSRSVTVTSGQESDDEDFGQDEDVTSPIVSVGNGNGNTPANDGPGHEAVVSSEFDVYATISDEHPASYHFRIIGVESSEVIGCENIFAAENQGFGGCRFAYNQAQATTTSLSNGVIATIDPAQLGDGEYWLILGATDRNNQRTDGSYLEDARIKIIVDTTVPPVAEDPGPGGQIRGNAPQTTSTTTSTTTEPLIDETILTDTATTTSTTSPVTTSTTTEEIVTGTGGGPIGSVGGSVTPPAPTEEDVTASTTDGDTGEVLGAEAGPSTQQAQWQLEWLLLTFGLFGFFGWWLHFGSRARS